MVLGSFVLEQQASFKTLMGRVSLSLSVPPASVEHGSQDKGFEKSSQMEFVL